MKPTSRWKENDISNVRNRSHPELGLFRFSKWALNRRSAPACRQKFISARLLQRCRYYL